MTHTVWTCLCPGWRLSVAGWCRKHLSQVSLCCWASVSTEPEARRTAARLWSVFYYTAVAIIVSTHTAFTAWYLSHTPQPPICAASPIKTALVSWTPLQLAVQLGSNSPRGRDSVPLNLNSPHHLHEEGKGTTLRLVPLSPLFSQIKREHPPPPSSSFLLLPPSLPHLVCCRWPREENKQLLSLWVSISKSSWKERADPGSPTCQASGSVETIGLQLVTTHTPSS